MTFHLRRQLSVCLVYVTLATGVATPSLAKAPENVAETLPADVLALIDDDPVLNRANARVRRAAWNDDIELISFTASTDAAQEQQPFIVTLQLDREKPTGLRYRIPFAQSSQNAAMKSLTQKALAIEPALTELDNPDGMTTHDNVARWLGELSLESWMRPRWGAYRMERRVGKTLFIFEGVPLKTLWISLAPARGRHPVAQRFLNFVPTKSRPEAEKVYRRIERGEYRQAAIAARPLAKAGSAWAQLVMADYGNEVGENLKLTSPKWLESSARSFLPTKYILGIPDSVSADTHLALAANGGFVPAISLLSAKNLMSAPARPERDSKLVRCDEAAAALGDTMAMLRAIWRVTEGGFQDNEEAYLRLKIAEARFGETISHTVSRFVMQPLGQLNSMLPAAQRQALDQQAHAWRPTGFDTLRASLEKNGCLD